LTIATAQEGAGWIEMTAIEILAGLLATLLAGLLVYKMRRLKPQMAGYASQRMCPSCGLITPRSKAACLECGKMLLHPPNRPPDER
jgi:hypothetical protein